MSKNKPWYALQTEKRKKGNYLLRICYDSSFPAASAPLSSVAQPSQYSLTEDGRKRIRNMLLILLFLKY